MRKEPWLTAESIDFIYKFLNKIEHSKILEFGSGGSTIWFLENFSCELTSIEHDLNWYNKTKECVKNFKNLNFILRESDVLEGTDYLIKTYSDEVEKFENNYFDLILIDGRDRVDCFKKSETKLKNGGLMILDNSEREEYNYINNYYFNKENQEFKQKEKDKYGFDYPNWTTKIWKK